MTNMTTVSLSKNALEVAIQQLTERDGQISIEPVIDLLPAPKYEGQVVQHPASLKKYTAKQEAENLVWEVTP